MKRIITLLLLLAFSKFATAQLSYDNETFSYNGFNVNHYGLWWYPDPAASSYGPMAYFSAYGGIKFFSMGAPRAVLDVNGYLGVGTMSPNGRLDVNGAVLLPGSTFNTMTRPAVGSTRITGEIAGYSSAGLTADDGFLRLSAGGGTTPAIKSYIDLSGYSTVPDMAENITLGTSGTERMRVTSNGNVGIGTTAPNGQLEISGGTTRDFLLTSSSGLSGSLRMRAWGNGVNFDSQTNNGTFYFGRDNALSNFIIQSGNVGIGTTNPGSYKLAVNGGIHSQSVNVDLTGWSDYVFKYDYKLPSLIEVKAYIDQNHHLPDMPSEQDVIKDGINLGEMDRSLTKKVEELTLYLIQQKEEADKENRSKQQQIDELKQQLNALIKALYKN